MRILITDSEGWLKCELRIANSDAVELVLRKGEEMPPIIREEEDAVGQINHTNEITKVW